MLLEWTGCHREVFMRKVREATPCMTCIKGVLFLLGVIYLTSSAWSMPHWKYAFGTGGWMDISGSQDMKPAWGLGLTFLYSASSRFRILFEAYRLQGHMIAREERFRGGSYTLSPIQIGFEYILPVNEHIHPYILFSTGLLYPSVRVNEKIKDAWHALGIRIEEELKRASGGFIGVGIDQRLSKQFFLTLDVRYLFGGPSRGTWSMTDKRTGISVRGIIPQVSVPRISTRFRVFITF